MFLVLPYVALLAISSLYIRKEKKCIVVFNDIASNNDTDNSKHKNCDKNRATANGNHNSSNKETPPIIMMILQITEVEIKTNIHIHTS